MPISSTTIDADGFQFLKECHTALHQHTSGNPRPYLDLWSTAEDVSLMGGVGGHQVGLDAVTKLLTATSKTLNYSGWAAETLVASFGHELGFSVELERLSRVLDDKPEVMELRVTTVYRLEDGAWRVIHRHGDPLMTVEIDPAGRR
jgi:SnoaL-like domain